MDLQALLPETMTMMMSFGPFVSASPTKKYMRKSVQNIKRLEVDGSDGS